jgi:hypothetical protein
MVLKILLHPQLPYEYDADVSSLLQTRTKHKNGLSVEDNLRRAHAATTRTIKKLAEAKQTHAQ